MKKIEIDPKAKALIFDIDGTLADSMTVHWKSYNKVLEPYGVEISFQYLTAMAGIPVHKSMEIISEKFHLVNFDPIKMGDKKEEIFRQSLSSVQPVAPVFEVFNSYYGKLPLACGTGGGHLNAYSTLKALGIIDKVNAIVTSEDVEKGKPAPDTFLLCAKRMGVNPSDCLVFEDANLGIEAAKNAGMMVIDIRPFLS